MTREEVDNYLQKNGADVLDYLMDYEVQDIMYGYTDEEMKKKLDELIGSHRKYSNSCDLPFDVNETKSCSAEKDILTAATDFTFMGNI